MAKRVRQTEGDRERDRECLEREKDNIEGKVHRER